MPHHTQIESFHVKIARVKIYRVIIFVLTEHKTTFMSFLPRAEMDNRYYWNMNNCPEEYVK